MKKIVFVTGAGRGIGRAMAEQALKDGYLVAGCARSMTELSELKALAPSATFVETVDVRSYEAQKNWMLKAIKELKGEPWGLVTAAGIYGPIGKFFDNKWEDWVQCMEINMYGTFHSCKAFSEILIERKLPGRIVMLSGGGATQPLPHFTGYCATKAAVVRFGETIAYELKEFGITVNSIAPGAVNTKLTEEVLKAGPEKAGKDMFEKTQKQFETGGAGTEKASALSSYLLSEKSADLTGRLISAIWDPWQTAHENQAVLGNKDAWTLRRQV